MSVALDGRAMLRPRTGPARGDIRSVLVPELLRFGGRVPRAYPLTGTCYTSLGGCVVGFQTFCAAPERVDGKPDLRPAKPMSSAAGLVPPLGVHGDEPGKLRDHKRVDGQRDCSPNICPIPPQDMLHDGDGRAR